MFGIVIAPIQSLAQQLSKEWESTEGSYQSYLERIPEEVSETRFCVWMHWHVKSPQSFPGVCVPAGCNVCT